VIYHNSRWLQYSRNLHPTIGWQSSVGLVSSFWSSNYQVTSRRHHQTISIYFAKSPPFRNVLSWILEKCHLINASHVIVNQILSGYCLNIFWIFSEYLLDIVWIFSEYFLNIFLNIFYGPPNAPEVLETFWILFWTFRILSENFWQHTTKHDWSQDCQFRFLNILKDRVIKQQC